VSARAVFLLVMATTAIALPAGAQRTDSTAAAPRADSSAHALACPGDGAMLRWWAGAAGDSAGRAARAADATRSRGTIDTVITLNITDRTWQRDSLSAGVSLGMAGTAGARGAPWRACAGVAASFGRITTTLHNVRGRIHLRADPGALAAIGRGTDSTPPAPPRR
jgi:hypothetical protein